jgi:polysaccharide export outer membrane protein
MKSQEKVMKTAIWTALLAVVPVLCSGGGGFQQKPADEQKPVEKAAKVPQGSQPQEKSPPPAQAPATGEPAPDGPSPENGKSTIPAIPENPSTGVAPAPTTGPAGMEAAPNSLKRVGGVPVDKTYVIGAEDQIGVNVWGVAPLSSAYLVRPDGKITMPLIGDVTAAGLTPEQLQNSIADRLKQKYINSPDVTVLVLAVNSKKYYIHGEVNSPGAYPLIVPTTVLEALAQAHGFKDFAGIKKIRIMRGTEQFKFNYKDVTRGRHLEQNIYLEPGDEIIVP